jgi:AraC-like DNA-binding protein
MSQRLGQDHMGGYLEWPERGPDFELILVRERKMSAFTPGTRCDHYLRLYRNLRGVMTLRVGKKLHRLAPGRVAVLAPETAFTPAVEKPLTHWYMHLALRPPWGMHPGLYFVEEALTRLSEPLLAAMGQATPTRVGLSLKALAQLWLSGLPESVWKKTSSDEVVARTLALLQERLAQPPPNRLLAEACGLNEDAFIRHFRRVTGSTPQAQGLCLRLDHGARLLDETRLSIDAIAEACGFSDRYHFTRAFTRRRKMAPATWRRRLQAQ